MDALLVEIKPAEHHVFPAAESGDYLGPAAHSFLNEGNGRGPLALVLLTNVVVTVVPGDSSRPRVKGKVCMTAGVPEADDAGPY